MKKRPLTQLVPDVRNAMEEVLAEVTETAAMDLKEAGPFWTGHFESTWQVNPGKKAVPANIANPLAVPKKPRTKEITPIYMPDSPNLGGYTLGNRAKYTLVAMDIVPLAEKKGVAVYRGDAPGATAPKFWFDTYVNARLPTMVNRTLQSVFRRFS